MSNNIKGELINLKSFVIGISNERFTPTKYDSRPYYSKAIKARNLTLTSKERRKYNKNCR